MSAVPIDAKSRGALLAARDSLADFRQDIEMALPAIEHCGVADVVLRGHWLAMNLKQIQTCIGTLIESTAEAHKTGRKSR